MDATIQSSPGVLDKILEIKDWRHPYQLSTGLHNQLYRSWYKSWHEWRHGVDVNNIDTILGGIAGKTFLDLACNDGYYGTQYARRGAKKVIGIDGRPEHIRRAELLRVHFGLANVEYHCSDIENMPADHFSERFDAVIMYGLLYHLCNPIGTLRMLSQLTARLIAIQTFMGDSAEAALLLHDDDVDLPGSGLFSLVCRPTQSAIVRMLQHAGFSTVLRVCPFPYYAHPEVKLSRKRHLGFFYGIKTEGDEQASILERLQVIREYTSTLERTQIVQLHEHTPPLVPAEFE
jgi:tRNA (mo5U34)-methyltransferase